MNPSLFTCLAWSSIFFSYICILEDGLFIYKVEKVVFLNVSNDGYIAQLW